MKNAGFAHSVVGKWCRRRSAYRKSIQEKKRGKELMDLSSSSGTIPIAGSMPSLRTLHLNNGGYDLDCGRNDTCGHA